MRKSSKDEAKDSLEGVTPEGVDPNDSLNYTDLKLRTNRGLIIEINGCKSVAASALMIGLCVGALLLMILMDRGWEGFLAFLGY